MLTGAGMNKEEAKEYTRRYRFSPTDNAQTALSKMSQLERELNSVGETVGKGRGGWAQTGQSAPQTNTPAVPKLGQLQQGYRFKGGDPADPNSWVKAQ
jgi:hypothetical protein